MRQEAVTMEKNRKPLAPLPLTPSQYGIGTELPMRANELPEMGGVLMKELFPGRNCGVLFPGEGGLEAIRRHTAASLENVDMSMIKAGDSVNILGSHHSFTLMGGLPYVEMIKTLKQVVQERTGVKDIRFVVGVGLRFRESEEYIKRFGLDDFFEGKARGMAPIDRGIPIETKIGTLYGLKKPYDADWIIHTHNTDIREAYCHRMVDRIIKPFAMSYARVETRGAYHYSFGPRAANFIARAIFESKMVQSKFAFSTILKVFPLGITGIDSDNDLFALNDRTTLEALHEYGKVVTLLGRIPECIVILDCPAPIPYNFGGGVIFCNFLSANVDQFDLDIPNTPYSPYSERSFGHDDQPLYPDVPRINPAIKMIVNNYSFKGFPSAFFAQQVPTIVVGEKMARLFDTCPQNPEYMSHAVRAESLQGAMKFAYRATGTRNVIVFDGAMGGINASNELIRFLIDNAAKVGEEVETQLMPKWLRQRGLSQSVDSVQSA
jgi:hypothetical protein